MSQIQAKDLDKNMKYYKITNISELHNKIQYKTGLNKDILEFNPTGSAGGLYFFSEVQLCNFQRWINFIPYWIREVTFDGIEDTHIYIEDGKYKTYQFILGERTSTDAEHILKYINFSKNNIAEQVVKLNGIALKYVPEDMKTHKLCLTAILNNGIALEYVPDNFKTYKFCSTAIYSDSNALRFVPEHILTDKMCTIAAQCRKKKLTYMPTKFLTPKICLLLVTAYGTNLKIIPDEHKTYKICMHAIKNYGRMLSCVPKNLITLEMCVAATKNSMWALQDVPECLKEQLRYYQIKY